MPAQAPIDGIAGVVGALIKRLDCREVGLVRLLGEPHTGRAKLRCPCCAWPPAVF